MKSTMYKRTLLLSTALLLSIATCFAQDESSNPVVGKWTKSFNERPVSFTMSSENKYEVEFAGDAEIDVWGSYSISGNQITFSDEGGEYGSNESGVYEFKVSENTITFTPVDDPVYGRSILVEGTWSKAPEAP